MNSIQEIVDAIQKRLKTLGDSDKIPAMAKYGITPEQTFGVKVPHLRAIAKEYRRNHNLALALWKINNRETRILATMIDDPKQLTEDQMENWAMEFDYWEICDQACMNLFEKHPLAWQKAIPVAEKIAALESKSARWIAADALRELKSDAVQKRLKN